MRAKTTERERAAMRDYYRRNADHLRDRQRERRKQNVSAAREYDLVRGGSEVRGPVEQRRAHVVARYHHPERQPCEVCGELGERHHDDYSRPRDIRWLCRTHHGETHRRID